MRRRPERPHRLRPSAIVLVVLLAGACTEEPPPNPPRVELDSPGAPAADEPATAAGRLVVIDDLGNLLTVAPDGSGKVVIEEAVAGERVLRQPTWSPDGRRLAWVRIEAGDDGGSAALVTSATEGGPAAATFTPVAPFYLSWDPTSSRIAYLGSLTPDEIHLGVVDVTEGGDPLPLDAGRPLYLSWDPTGSELLVHVGTDRLDRLELDGTRTPVHLRPGSFNTPVWTADGTSLVYAAGAGDRQRLVVHDLDRARPRELVRYAGAILFVVSPDGSRIAFQVVGEGVDVGPLSVVDAENGAVEEVHRGIVPAFFWSPAGDRLLFASIDEGPDRVWFRWNVWDGSSSFAMPRFVPTTTFGREFLQFFEQYAQSVRLWSPDGTAFTYAGAGENGEQGIWVQPAVAGAQPVRISDGVFAAWSPS